MSGCKVSGIGCSPRPRIRPAANATPLTRHAIRLEDAVQSLNIFDPVRGQRTADAIYVWTIVMQTNGPTNRSQPTVAVVGAGISGLTCARTLADHGLPVTVFEKSRGVGGHMATRRSDNGAAFDHGAQYFTVRDKRFQNCVDSWQHAGLVQRWNGRIVSRHDQNTEQDKSSTARFVACPGMNAICRHLAENLDIRTNTRVALPTRCQGKWLVSDATGSELGRYDVVIAPTEPLPDRYLFNGDSNIGACGDWCAGPRVEGAFLSGVALAERLLALDGQ